MALEISEFFDIAHSTTSGEAISVVESPPSNVITGTGAKTLGSRTTLIRIKGSGTITWANGTAETFDATEYRKVKPGTAFTVS